MKERATKTSSEWEQWPGRTPDPQPRKRLRGLFMPTDAADEVANLLAEHGKELEERSAQIREAVVALEQREERARESTSAWSRSCATERWSSISVRQS